MANEMVDGRRHGIDVAGRAGHRLGQHPPLRIEHAGGKITAFPNDRAERRSKQRGCLFLDHSRQAMPHDLKANGVPLGHAITHAPSPFRFSRTR